MAVEWRIPGIGGIEGVMAKGMKSKNPIEASIARVEAIARQLEPDSGKRQSLNRSVLEYADRFLESIRERPAYRAAYEEALGIEASAFSEEPARIADLLELIGRHVDGPGLNPASGGHLAYIPGGGIFPSALGDYLAAVTNRYAGVYFAGPGAVRMERLLIRWMAGLVGGPDTAGGDLTSGGSIATLIGIVCGREGKRLRAADFSRAVVYMTRHAHHSVEKSLGVAGLKEAVQRFIDVDAAHRMRPDALEKAIGNDRKQGLLPWMVIGSAGTTDTGAIDPLEEIGAVAAGNDLWFHIDAAYGGFFLLCEDGKRLLKGIDRGDSIVMDPHKGLFLPYGSGAVLVKDRSILRKAHTYHAHYMQDAREKDEELSPADQSPELTRHFRGLRLWLPLKLFGIAPFRACLEEKLLLARYFFERIREVPGFEVGAEPELSVVTYRYLPRRGDADDFNRRLIGEIHKDGRVFLSSTRLDGKFTLRLAALAFRTHKDTIDMALEILREKARELERDF